MRLLIRVHRHSYAKWLQLFIGFGRELPKRSVVALPSQRVDERCVELRQPIDQGLARIATDVLRACPRRIQLADDAVQDGVERSIGTCSKSGQPCDHAFDMCRNARSRTRRARYALR